MNTQTTISRPDRPRSLNRFGAVAAVALFVTVIVSPVSLHAAETAGYDFETTASAAAGSIMAANPAQGFESIISSDGVSVRADSAGWEVGLSLTGFGRGERLAAVEPAAVTARGPRAELTRADLVEWYHNDERGLEQGFTIHQRPPGEGSLVLEMTLTGGLLPLAGDDGLSVSLASPGGALAAASYSSLVVEDAGGARIQARLEVGIAQGDGGPKLRIVVDDAGACYPLMVDPLLSNPVWSSSESEYTESVEWGDWDGDGDLDLAVGNSGTPNRVYSNSDGALALVWTSADTDDSSRVAWGDWDGDGDLDLAAANLGGPNRVYENDGLGLPTSLTSAWTSAESETTFDVAWADFDGDGDLDLAAANLNESLRVYANSGGTLSSAWTAPDSEYATTVAWGDWDGDGDLDLATGAWVNGATRVYSNSGGALSLAWTATEGPSATRALAWGDWDGDGDLDLAVGGNPTVVWSNTGGAFTLVWSSADPDDSTWSVAWGDWDGDGDLDLAVGKTLGPDRVYENDGLGLPTSLTSAWTSADSDDTYSVAWGDWDGDGDLELAAGNGGQPNRIYLNSGGALTSSWTSVDSGSHLGIAWGDWDGDGDLDLAIASSSSNRVYENEGGALTPGWSSADSDDTVSVAWGDWDGDGDLDLAAGNDGVPNRVYANSGGILSSAWTSADSDATRTVAWGDWDGDGDLDLAAGNWGQPNRVYANSGGGLTSAWTSAESEFTWSVAWGDWDVEGDLDLAAGNWGQPNRVYANSGGGLTSTWISAESEFTWSVAWGDWDADGDPELAVGNNGQNRVYANSGGNLSSAWTSADSDQTPSVAWGDWDADGDLDLAAGNAGTPNRVYVNSGGDLSSIWTSAESDNTWSVAWGDWDADGDLDLAAGNDGQPNRVSSNGWLSRPRGLPQTPTSPVLADRPGSTDAAYFHSSEECLASPVELNYTLVDEESDPARRIRVEYSVTGSGPWFEATEATGAGSHGLVDLTASHLGEPHLFVWDATADGVDSAEQASLRVVVLHQTSTRVAGPIQRAAMAAASPPFRICQPIVETPLFADGFESGSTSAWN
jgi:hypothetical protein